MEVVTGAMSTLLPKLGDLLKEEYKLQKSVRGEILFLTAELESMQAALLEISDAPIDQPSSRQEKLWARQVRELSYDLEDNIDKFMVHVDHAPTNQLQGLRGFIDKSLNLLTRHKNLNLLTKAKIRHEICTDIKDIKTRIKEVSERRHSYKVDNAAAKTPVRSVDSLRLLALYRKATELIGTEEKSNDIIKRLMEQDEASKRQLKTVSIFGMGGLGKTTLANVVYQKLIDQFDCAAFVTISLNPVTDKIFKTMLHQLDSVKYVNINQETWDEAQLINELRDFLRDKRYFIVIDDIWDKSKSVWATIQCALIDNENGSRIITTTRNLNVARLAGGAYELKPLSSADSRKLFHLRMFGTEDGCPKEFAKVSENILKKCGGVPLAIITIASMLASKKEKENTLEYWSEVYRSMGSGLQDSSDMDDMRRILSVSYYDLPPHLRTCMLYLSIYPEDYRISTEDLICKWIGEGFIVKKQGKALYEVGEDYVHELINRSLIQPEVIDNDSMARYCYIHDLVLDLITCLANEDEFVTTLHGQSSMHLPNRIRRLAIQTNIEEDFRQLLTMNLSHLRSLIVFKGSLISLVPSLSSLPVLRVLDIGGCEQVKNHHCKVICNLCHLRCLVLHNTSITEIPKEIGNLQFLQVLDIHNTLIVELPSSFVQLKQLVFLRYDRLLSIPDGFGNLKFLQEMVGQLHMKSPTMLRIFGGLTELRRVDLFFYEWDESYKNTFLWCLSSMVSLKYLLIDGKVEIDLGSPWDKLLPGPEHLQIIKIKATISAVPTWMSSLSMLLTLHLKLLTLRQEDLQVLGSIPCLSELDVWVNEPTQGGDKKLVIHNGSQFLCLRKFIIRNNMELMFEQGAMQNLKILRFGVNEMMDQFGEYGFGLENLSSLEHVTVGMLLSQAKPEDVEAAEAALQRAVDMNPRKPILQLEKVCVLKLKIHPEGRQKQKVMKIISKLHGIDMISFDQQKGKLTVIGLLIPTTILETLNKHGIQAEPWDFRG